MRNLQQLKTFLETTGLPFVLGGDWNMTTDTLRTCSILDELKADIITATDLNITCTSGRGRTLDYWVVSRCLVPLVASSVRDPQASWNPHIGLKLTISARPRTVHVVEIVKPPHFPEQGPKDGPTWVEAITEAKEHLSV